jgi:hypothetical protein
MITFGIPLEEKVKDEIAQQIAARVEQISHGQMSPDDYKHNCGYVKALRDVLAMFEDAHKSVNADKEK